MASMRVWPTTASGLRFLDLAQCEGFATGLVTREIKPLQFSRAEATEIAMNKHVSSAKRQAQTSGRETSTPELDALTWGAEEALRAMVECQVESLRFIARRTYCNLEFLRQLRHCAGWPEVAKECVADYGEELGRLAGTGFQLARSDFTPLQWLMYRKGGNGAAG
jgi:hypothetical protein